MLDEGHVGLDEARLDFVVAQAGAGIESTDVVERLLHGFDGTADRLSNLFVQLVLQSAQMLVDYRRGIFENLLRAVAILVECQLRLVVAELVEQAPPKVAARDAGRIELTHY